MTPPRSHRCDQFQPGIPRRVALQQSSPPLPRPTLMLNPQLPFVQKIPANGIQGLFPLSHSRGSPHGLRIMEEGTCRSPRQTSAATQQKQRQYSSRCGFASTPAFGREEAAARRGLGARTKVRAYLRSTARAEATDRTEKRKQLRERKQCTNESNSKRGSNILVVAASPPLLPSAERKPLRGGAWVPGLKSGPISEATARAEATARTEKRKQLRERKQCTNESNSKRGSNIQVVAVSPPLLPSAERKPLRGGVWMPGAYLRSNCKSGRDWDSGLPGF